MNAKNTIFAAVRCTKLNRTTLARAEAHGKRTDLKSDDEKVRQKIAARIRDDFDPSEPRSFGWAFKQGEKHLDIQAAHRAYVARENAKLWGKRPKVALHFILVTSPEWVQGEGDPYSNENKRVQDLLREAPAWANKQIGGCFAVRYDIDEKSCGVIDVFCAPVLKPGGNRKNDFIMPEKSLSELQSRTDEHTTFAALQTSWAEHCQSQLDPVFQRGRRKDETKAKHINQDLIRKKHEEEEARLAALEFELNQRQYEMNEEIGMQERALAGLERDCAAQKQKVDEWSDRERSTKQRIADLEALEERQVAKLRARAEEAEKREAYVAEGEADVAARQANVAEREADVTTQEASVAEREADVATREAEQAELPKRVKRLEKENLQLWRGLRIALDWCVERLPEPQANGLRKWALEKWNLDIGRPEPDQQTKSPKPES